MPFVKNPLQIGLSIITMFLFFDLPFLNTSDVPATPSSSGTTMHLIGRETIVSVLHCHLTDNEYLNESVF